MTMHLTNRGRRGLALVALLVTLAPAAGAAGRPHATTLAAGHHQR